MRTLDCEADIEAALTSLVGLEPAFAAVIAAHGSPPLRRANPGLDGLLRIITDQLISRQAGIAIWRRIEARLSPFDPQTIARQRKANLMKLGLSGAKARSFKAVAAAVSNGTLDFTALANLSDAEALKALTALDGVGPWTAEIFLLTAMGRADAWPAGDLALQVAAQHLFNLDDRPNHKTLTQMAEGWRPWRAVAARLLWSHYRGLKGISQTVL